MLKKLFKKPSWENKDPEIRRRAIAQLQGDELTTILPGLARSDPSAVVRARAVQRLTSLEMLRELAESDEADTVRDQARLRIRALLTGGAAEGIDLETRIRATHDLADVDLAEHLLQRADDPAVRKAALAHVTRPGVLADVVVKDDDAELRELALARIERESTLVRIADQTRKHDKRIHRLAGERLVALQLARGDAEAVRATHVDVCQRLEQEIWAEPGALAPGKLNAFITEWNALPTPEPPLAQRFEKACARARDSQRPRTRPGKNDADAQMRQVCDALQRLHDQLEVPQGSGARDLAAMRGTLHTLTAQGRQMAAALPKTAAARFEDLRGDIETRLETLAAARGTPPALARARKMLASGGVDERAIARLEEQWKKGFEQKPAAYRPHHAAFRETLAELRKQAAQAREQRETLHQNCSERLDRTEELLATGEFHDARAAHREATELIRQNRFRGDLEQRARQLGTQLREMQGWQHWANEKQRVRLCEETEQLVDIEMEPLELARKIKELRKQWDRLEESEKLPGDEHHAAGPRLWRRFHSACHRAYAPCAEFFQQRAETRKQKLEELTALCERLEATAATMSPDDMPTTENAVRQAARALGQVGQLNPRDRGRVARRLRDLLGRFNEALAVPREQNRQRKQALITRAKGLHHLKDLEEATKKVRELEDEWRGLGPADKDDERELQQEFRAACDVILGQEAEKNAEAARERREKQQQLIALCETIEQLARSGGDALLSGEARIWQAQTEWDELEFADRKLESRFHRACDALRARLRRHQQELRESELALLEQKAALCARLEADRSAEESIVVEWNALPALRDESFEERIDRRFKSARSGDRGGAREALEAAQELCLRLEILAGIDSPPEMQQARMDYRVAQLSSALAGGQEPVDTGADAWSIRRDFCFCGPLPNQERDAVIKRFGRALQALAHHSVDESNAD